MCDTMIFVENRGVWVIDHVMTRGSSRFLYRKNIIPTDQGLRWTRWLVGHNFCEGGKLYHAKNRRC